MEHRGLDRVFDALRDAVERDELETARVTADFKFHLDLHLAKEDAHRYPVFPERVSVPDQATAVGVMVVCFHRTATPSSSRGCSRSSATTTVRP